jgi:hypothetical protein
VPAASSRARRARTQRATHAARARARTHAVVRHQGGLWRRRPQRAVGEARGARAAQGERVLLVSGC